MILLSPCFVFLQKLILPGFLLLFEGYHENLREISDPSMYITFLGMVWGPSYEGFVILLSPCFVFLQKLILLGFLLLFV